VEKEQAINPFLVGHFQLGACDGKKKCCKKYKKKGRHCGGCPKK
tara:strand:+ start:335 stop:466 length:132 start_codon:yes stop_codon:yes gene_type:complete